MTQSPKVQKVSEQCQDDCTGENFVRKRAVSQIYQKQWGTKWDSDRFYVNSVLRDQTILVKSKTGESNPIEKTSESNQIENRWVESSRKRLPAWKC